MSPRGDRPSTHPIVFLEPMDGDNRESLGFDMWTDPVQRATMERARDSGQPTLSAKVGANTPIDKGISGGFIVYVPIYRTGAPIQTVEERRQALVGFVFSPFQPVALFSDIDDEMPSVAFEVYDGALPQPAALLHRSADPTGTLGYQSTRLVHVAGREWLMILTSLGGTAVGFRRRPADPDRGDAAAADVVPDDAGTRVHGSRRRAIRSCSRRPSALFGKVRRSFSISPCASEKAHPGAGGGPFERRVSSRTVPRSADHRSTRYWDGCQCCGPIAA